MTTGAGDRADEEPGAFAQWKGSLAQPTTIQHWQLRDLVQCERAHEAHCVHGQEVVRYDGQKEEGTIVQQLKFSPTSMTVSHGYVGLTLSCVHGQGVVRYDGQKEEGTISW